MTDAGISDPSLTCGAEICKGDKGRRSLEPKVAESLLGNMNIIGRTDRPSTVLGSLQMTLTSLGIICLVLQLKRQRLRALNFSHSRPYSQQVAELSFEPGTLALKASPLLPPGLG